MNMVEMAAWEFFVHSILLLKQTVSSKALQVISMWLRLNFPTLYGQWYLPAMVMQVKLDRTTLATSYRCSLTQSYVLCGAIAQIFLLI
ncbi:MAG: hypothetical protein HWQ42_09985 [Nostoc sp. JL23]|nr:hypothetical protein [Nostoc sp. JL23]